MDLGGGSWGLMTIVGPLVLALVLLWVVIRTFRKRERTDEVERSERATHDLYDQEEAARREEDGR